MIGLKSRSSIFSPKSFSDMEQWLNARDEDTLTKPSDRISDWLDKSGRGHDVIQTTGANEPLWEPTGLNGNPSVKFDDITAVKRLFSNDAASEWTFCNDGIDGMSVVCIFEQHTGLPEPTGPLVNTSARSDSEIGFTVQIRTTQDDLKFFIRNGAGGTTPINLNIPTNNTLDLNTPYFSAVTWENSISGDDATIQLRTSSTTETNGDNTASGPSSSAPDETLAIGASASGTFRTSNSRISEVMIYSRVLTDVELLRLRLYAFESWGV